MYNVIILHANGKVEKTTQSKRPDLAQLQKAVGGYIEVVPVFTKLVYEGKTFGRGTAYCNEDGIAQGLPQNNNAIVAWKDACPKGDPNRMILLGDVIFVSKEPEAK